MEPILEFKEIFSNKEYYIYLQKLKDSIYISIESEDDKDILYWKKNLENQTIRETTSQMGSFKSLEAFTEMLIEGLSKKNNNLVSIDFCSLNEIRELAGNDNNQNAKEENSIKKYLVIMNNKYERIVYPIQMDYLGPNGTPDQLKTTIRRIRKNKNNQENIKKLNFNLLVEKEKNEKLRRENENLTTKIKLLNEGRQLGAVDNDGIYKNYTELQEKYETYKMNTNNKIKILNKTIEELKEAQFKESQTNFHKNEIKKNKIQDLQQKINQNSEAFYQESKQYAKIIEERNREIDNLQKEIRKYIENERQMKVKISNLEKELEKEKRETNYYRYGNYTPKTSKSYKSNYSGSSYKNTSTNKRSLSNTNASYLKKNLIPSKYKYRAYKPFASNKYTNYNYKNRYGNNLSYKSNNSNRYSNSRKSYGSGTSNSSKKKYGYSKNYVSPYRYNKGASPYRYTNNNKIKSNNSKSKGNNSNKNSISKKSNSPYKSSHANYNKYSRYNHNKKEINEVKKNNFVIEKESKNKYVNNKYVHNTNNNKNGNQIEKKKKDNDYKSIGERLSKIQNLINQAHNK